MHELGPVSSAVGADLEELVNAEVRCSFITTAVREQGPSHTTRAPPVGFELATNGIQFYVIANLDRDVMPVKGGERCVQRFVRRQLDACVQRKNLVKDGGCRLLSQSREELGSVTTRI